MRPSMQQLVEMGLMFATRGSQAGVAGQYAYGMLWNPPASGKNFYVFTANVNPTASAGIVCGYRSTTIGVLNANAVPRCLRIGAPNGVAEMYFGTNATLATILPDNQHLANRGVVNSESAEFDAKGAAVIVPPNYGLIVRLDVVAIGINLSVLHAELPATA